MSEEKEKKYQFKNKFVHPTADSLDISKEKYKWIGGNGNKYNNKVRAVRKEDGTLKFE